MEHGCSNASSRIGQAESACGRARAFLLTIPRKTRLTAKIYPLGLKHRPPRFRKAKVELVWHARKYHRLVVGCGRDESTQGNILFRLSPARQDSAGATTAFRRP